MIESRAFARAGLLGNPSDGYFGRTISIIVRNFGARVSLYETPELEIKPSPADQNIFRSISQLVESIQRTGYYGAERLIKAAIRRFHDYCLQQHLRLPQRNFTIRYHSSIPRQVGLAGSSAIITATLRALMQFFEVAIPKQLLPGIILAAESEELGINAGLQDRVIQVYEGCVFMDFEERYLKEHGHGRYQEIDPALLPNLYIAYKTTLGKVSGKVLNPIRTKYEAGDKIVRAELRAIAALAETGKSALRRRDTATLNDLINENFDRRRRIMDISEPNLQMVQTARRCGASAKFAGSGGSIIGIYDDDEMLGRLTREMKKIDARVIKPQII